LVGLDPGSSLLRLSPQKRRLTAHFFRRCSFCSVCLKTATPRRIPSCIGDTRPDSFESPFVQKKSLTIQPSIVGRPLSKWQHQKPIVDVSNHPFFRDSRGCPLAG
jgi:hypothetical protein